jgi:hypothetical protein
MTPVVGQINAHSPSPVTAKFDQRCFARLTNGLVSMPCSTIFSSYLYTFTTGCSGFRGGTSTLNGIFSSPRNHDPNTNAIYRQ